MRAVGVDILTIYCSLLNTKKMQNDKQFRTTLLNHNNLKKLTLVK